MALPQEPAVQPTIAGGFIPIRVMELCMVWGLLRQGLQRLPDLLAGRAIRPRPGGVVKAQTG